MGTKVEVQVRQVGDDERVKLVCGSSFLITVIISKVKKAHTHTAVETAES